MTAILNLKTYITLIISLALLGCVYKNAGDLPTPIDQVVDSTATSTPQTPVVVDPNTNNTGVCNTTNMTYFGNIKVILDANCVTCHNGPSGSGGINLASYQGVSNASTKIYGSITHLSGYSPMPSSSDFIPKCSIDQIKAWLDSGKKEGTISTSPIEPTTGAKVCSPDTVYFTNTILPIYANNCASSGCHDSQSRRDGVILVDYKTIMQNIKPNKPNNSEYYTILFKTGKNQMPPAGPISEAQKKLIFTWISQGALNNVCK